MLGDYVSAQMLLLNYSFFFQIDTVFNPHPAAAAAPWVDNTAAVVDQHPVVPQPMIPDQHIGHDSEGIDGFPREVA